MKRILLICSFFIFPLLVMAQEEEEDFFPVYEFEASSSIWEPEEDPFKEDGEEECIPETPSVKLSYGGQPEGEIDRRWYFEIRPAYYYFTDSLMRKFFNSGGFTFRGEIGYRFWKPLMVWLDGGYFQKKGSAIGGGQDLHIQVASITLGLKTVCYFHQYFGAYLGAGPRVFMMLLKNDSPYVRCQDNKVDIGGGFDAGFWVFPFKRNRNVFIDFFVDYSLKKMGTDPDILSSQDFDVNISGLSAGIGLGGRF